MPVFLVVFMYALWSSVFSLGKMALAYSPPVFLTGFRMTFGGIILLGFLILFKKSSFRFSKKQWISFLLLAAFSVYLPNIFEFWGLQYLSAAKTCFIYSLSPIFAIFFSYIHFKEKMNKTKWLGLGISFLGFIPALMMQSGSEELLNAFGFFSWPTLAIAGAAFTSAYAWVLLRLVVKDKKNQTSPLMANGMSMLIGGLFAFFHSFMIESWAPTPVTAGQFMPFLQGVAIIIVLSNIVCYNLYGMALKRYTATFLSFVGLLSPIFASLNEWILLGILPSWQIFLSTGIVCTGLFVVYRAELKQGYILKKSEEPAEEETTTETLAEVPDESN